MKDLQSPSIEPTFRNHMFDDAGANGLVLFNRFYQPDIDLDALEVTPKVLLSTPQAMRLPLRWIAILHGRIKADLAGTSGIHTGEDAIKMLMVGANVTMLCSVELISLIAAYKVFVLPDPVGPVIRQFW